MKTDLSYYDHVGSPFRPDWIESSPADAKIGLLSVHRIDRTLVTEICWGTLDTDGGLISGAVTIEWRDFEVTRPAAKERLRVYRNAALALNRRLRGVIIEKTDFRPSRSAETSFYEQAQVKPTWLRAGAGAYALFDELRIEVANGMGFQPYLPPWTEHSAEEGIIARLEAYRALREFRRQSFPQSFGVAARPAKTPKRYQDIIRG